MSKARIIEIGGVPHLVRSTGRVRDSSGDNVNSYAVRPEAGGDEWTALVPPGRDVAEHLSWVAAGSPGDFGQWSGYGGRV